MLPEELTVDRERTPRDRARSKRQHARLIPHGTQSCAVTLERPKVRENPVSCPYWLPLLEVRVSREDDLDRLGRPVQKGRLYLPQDPDEAFRRVHAPQAKVGRHLVVTRPSCMEFTGDLTDLLV